MKKTLVFIFLMFAVTFVTFSSEKVRGVTSTKVLVLPFTIGEGVSKEYSNIANEAFSIAISKSKKFEIVLTKTEQTAKRNDLGEVEQKNNDSINTELAKFYGAKIVFSGSINEIDGAYSIIIKGIEIETKLLRYAERGMCASQAEIISTVETIAYKIANISPSRESFNEMSKDEIIERADEVYRGETVVEPEATLPKEKEQSYHDANYITSFNNSDKKYIRKYIDPTGTDIFDLDAMRKLHKKHLNAGNALLGWGIAFSIIGQVALVGLIGLNVYQYRYGYYYYDDYGNSNSYNRRNMAYYIDGGKVALSIITPIFLVLSLFFMPFSSIPYWHANKVKRIALKANGKNSWSFLENSAPFINYSDDKIGIGLTVRI